MPVIGRKRILVKVRIWERDRSGSKVMGAVERGHVLNRELTNDGIRNNVK